MLDDYAAAEVRFVKIDVEGFEPNVLAGSPQLLGGVRPLVAMEFNTWALLLHHYDPLVFADTLWACCEISDVYGAETRYATPVTGPDLVHMNLTQHGCVSDLLLRPHAALPDLATMTQTPSAGRLRAELSALRASTSWRVTAPLRAVKQALARHRPG